MAKVILGGLITSTLLNMYIIPIMYRIMHRKELTEESATIQNDKI
jgi:Cu(I)/Ag(I) efflux system membrane protein CusA/SilA